MKLLPRIGGLLAAIAIGVTPLTVSVPAQAHSKTVAGCPRGYVCLYERNESRSKGNLEKKWFDYGVYNLHHVYGRHWIMNNQWGGAYVTLYTKANGHGKCYTLKAGKSGSPTVHRRNFTPIDSIRLSKHRPDGCKRV